MTSVLMTIDTVVVKIFDDYRHSWCERPQKSLVELT
jgi:hypothetical protein